VELAAGLAVVLGEVLFTLIYDPPEPEELLLEELVPPELVVLLVEVAPPELLVEVDPPPELLVELVPPELVVLLVEVDPPEEVEEVLELLLDEP